jgi:hypothetical protein
MKHHHSKNI